MFKGRRATTVMGVSLLLVPAAAYVFINYIYVDNHQEPFDKQVWDNGPIELRWNMVSDLTARVLPGKTKAECKEIVGGFERDKGVLTVVVLGPREDPGKSEYHAYLILHFDEWSGRFSGWSCNGPGGSVDSTSEFLMWNMSAEAKAFFR